MCLFYFHCFILKMYLIYMQMFYVTYMYIYSFFYSVKLYKCMQIILHNTLLFMIIFQFLAIGTHWGVIHVLDHQGNNISGKEFAKVNINVCHVCMCKVLLSWWIKLLHKIDNTLLKSLHHRLSLK